MNDKIKENMSKRKWRWFEELRQERERDIKIEMSEKGQTRDTQLYSKTKLSVKCRNKI